MQPSLPSAILWIERPAFWHPAEPSAKIAKEYASLIMPCSVVDFSRTKLHEKLCQKVDLGDFNIWTHDVLAFVTHQLGPYTPEHILALHYMSQSNVDAAILNKIPVKLVASQYNLFNLPEGLNKATLSAGEHFFSFHINTQPGTFARLKDRFPELARLAEKEEQLKMAPGPVNNSPLMINDTIRLLIENILACRFINLQAKYYLYRACVDLHIIFANQDKNLELDRQPLTLREEKSLKKCYDLLTRRLDIAITPAEMARATGMNARDLSRAFLHEYGMSMEKFHYMLRMMEAYRSIVQGSGSLSGIAHRTGFINSRQLTREFVAYYRIHPHELTHAQ